MAPIPGNILTFICAVVAVFNITPLDGCPIPTPPKNNHPGLDAFDLLPITPPASSIPAGSVVQFNGSYPGQGDLTEQLGWFPKPVAPATSNAPIDFISFIQYNHKEGIAFWVERSLFQIFLRPVPDSPETYSVMVGSISVEPKPVLSGNFTVTEITKKTPQETRTRYNFGWKGDIDNWFTCGGNIGDGAYYGLYYGKKLDWEGCSEKFQLEARYHV